MDELPGAPPARSIVETESPVARWLQAPRTPLIAMPLAALGYWVFESLLHANYFNNRSFLAELVSPDPHELWMRAVVTSMLAVIAIAWRRAAIERGARIASLERYQARLHELTLHLASAESDERRALAARLHEDVGQQLAAARLFLASIDQFSQEDRAALASAARIVDRTTAEVRDIAEELQPRSLEGFGFGEALHSLARRMMRRNGVSIEVDIAPECVVLSNESSRIGFQVVAEVLEVASRHESAKLVRVGCSSSPDGVEIAVTWGEKLDADLFFASERLARVGGSLAVTPSESETLVRLRFPNAA